MRPGALRAAPWRWAWLHYRAGRGLGWVALGTGVVFALGIRTLSVSVEATARFFFGPAVVLPLVLAAGAVSRDRRASRWLLIFQASVTPAGHYMRVLVLALAVVGALLLGGTVLLSAAGLLLRETHAALWGLLAGALLWAGMITVVSFGVSTLLPRAAGAVSVLYLMASFLQVLLLRDLGLHTEGLVRIVRWLMVPLDPMATAWQQLAGLGPGPSRAGWIQMGLFAAAWLAIAYAALIRLERADLPLRED